jgi:hypothetical protein
MDQSTGRLLGAVYLALTQGLSQEGVELANDILYSIADQSPAHEARILRNIADSCSGVPDSRPQLALIDGGAA